MQRPPSLAKSGSCGLAVMCCPPMADLRQMTTTWHAKARFDLGRRPTTRASSAPPTPLLRADWTAGPSGPLFPQDPTTSREIEAAAAEPAQNASRTLPLRCRTVMQSLPAARRRRRRRRRRHGS
ncbi:hypothetical protein CDD83_367 [Cordyceps sp. RAO-2017]|nr:hypothetical protein CDD83_367 [Cordyceps sp. RAO-2017]